MKSLGVYIHVPFCRKKCDYCSFYSVNYDSVLAQSYTDSVIRNIQSEKKNLSGYVADTVYFGGGTPSLLNDAQLSGILNAVRENIVVSDDAEITIECNPADINDLFFEKKSDLSFNRFSIGVQTLNSEAYEFLGRNGGFADERFLQTLERSAQYSISLDYISALSEQTSENAISELNRMILTGVKHFSVYLLSVEKGTPLHERFEIPKCYDNHQAEMYRLVKEHLELNGFNHYEISNFSRPGFESRHNLKYWNFDDYIGFGPGAHSFVAGCRFSFDEDVNGYISGNSVKINDERSESDALDEYLMTALRLRSGLSFDKMRTLFSGSLYAKAESVLKSACETGKLEMLSVGGMRHVRIPDSDIVFTDSIVESLCSQLV